MGRSILVTGGSGYFFDVNPPAATAAGVEYVQGDVRDRDAVRAACDGVDVVLHNVAQVPLARDPRALPVGERGRHREPVGRRARSRCRQGRAHAVERGVRDPGREPGHRGHAL